MSRSVPRADRTRVANRQEEAPKTARIGRVLRASRERLPWAYVRNDPDDDAIVIPMAGSRSLRSSHSFNPCQNRRPTLYIYSKSLVHVFQKIEMFSMEHRENSTVIAKERNAVSLTTAFMTFSASKL